MIYDIQEVIKKMKVISNISTNVALANLLKVSYNTLNTWIKRGKIPQEVLLDFCNTYQCSLDNLLLNRKDKYPLLFTINSNKNINKSHINKLQSRERIVFYGEYKPLNIRAGTEIEIDKSLNYSYAYYLLFKENIYFLSQVVLNPFKERAYINEYDIEISLKEFNEIKIGVLI